jgi:2-polyprenyl-3-methyl-5-hydroxy-6-metoxy-1,4-benzoquinol methylase
MIFKKKQKCTVCNNDKFTLISNLVRDSKNHQIIKCSFCTHIQLSPLPSSDEYKRFYETDLQMSNIGQTKRIYKLKQLSKSDTTRRADLICKLINNSKIILDIGAGYGFFVEEMIKRGYCVEGLEISKEKLARMPKSLIPIITARSIEDRFIDAKKYDCVTLFFLLEHVLDPAVFCHKISKLLSSKGYLVIEVPNLIYPLISLNKGYRNFFWQMAHINYFKKEILNQILKKAGYQNIDFVYVQRYSIDNFINWIKRGIPQIANPSFEKSKKYPKLDKFYRSELINLGKSDTLIAIAQKN